MRLGKLGMLSLEKFVWRPQSPLQDLKEPQGSQTGTVHQELECQNEEEWDQTKIGEI